MKDIKVTKEDLAKAILEMNDKEFKAFKSGINQITFEYGWENEDLDNNKIINRIYCEKN